MRQRRCGLASSSNPLIINYFFNPKLQTMADKNGEDENCINGPGDEFEVRRKRNGNGDEKCCYGEEYAKILEHLGCHQKLGLHELAKREAYKGE